MKKYLYLENILATALEILIWTSLFQLFTSLISLEVFCFNNPLWEANNSALLCGMDSVRYYQNKTILITITGHIGEFFENFFISMSLKNMFPEFLIASQTSTTIKCNN